jgi:hypothetical protein
MIIRKFKSPVFSKEVIVDNEISNDISTPKGDWNYEQGDIICCGILKDDEIIVMLREKTDTIAHYQKYLKQNLSKIKTMYAFNNKMELGNFKGFLGESYKIDEIKPFMGRGWSKQKFFEELVKDKKTNMTFSDPLENNSKKVLNCYKNEDYESIVNHNLADLVKQAIILQNKNYLINKYSDYLSEDGWILDGVIE